MEVSFSPSFLRTLKTLPLPLREMALEKIDLFQDPSRHAVLKVHKLRGRLRECYAFSVNYQFRIVFAYVGKPRRAYLLAIGDHTVYDQFTNS